MSISASSNPSPLRPQTSTPLTQSAQVKPSPAQDLPNKANIAAGFMESELPEIQLQSEDQTQKNLGAASFAAQELVFNPNTAQEQRVVAAEIIHVKQQRNAQVGTED